MDSSRLGRINAELKKEIANIINYELSDPRLSGIRSVTRVESDNELERSNVYISILASNEEERQSSFLAIRSSASYIRKTLSHRLKLRTVPYLNFILDTSIEYSEKINAILNTINIPEDED